MKLQTPLSVEQCLARLTEAADIERLAFTKSGFAGTKNILAKTKGASFRLQKRRFYRNGFAPAFYGEFKAGARGAVIEGEFKMRLGTRIFMTFWFGFLALMIAGLLVMPQTGATALPVLVPILLMAAFGAGLIKFGQRLGRSEQDEIADFLKTSFEVTPTAA